MGERPIAEEITNSQATKVMMIMATEDRQQPSLKRVNLAPEYNTEENNVIREFYGPCLKASTRYERAVGFFRANIYRELGEDLLDFVVKGGTVSIVCSPDIPEADETAAREGYELRGKRSQSEQDASLTETMRSMAASPMESDCLSMLRLLIEMKALDLYVAIRPGGIFHRKIGRFVDSDSNYVIFSGSGNETQRAISSIEDWSNDEDFDVFRSWGEDFEKRKAGIKAGYLSKLLHGGTKNTKVRPLNEVERAFLAEFRSHSDLEECRPGARARSAHLLGHQKVAPYYYQEQAIEAWENNGRCGILSMATGTGKTLTALFSIEDMIEDGNAILVLVPSRILFNQWYENIMEIYPQVPVLLAGAGHDWKADKSKRMYVSTIGLPRFILATMHTASSDDFLEYVSQAKDLVLIADEVHRLGSPKHRRLLDLDFKAKLGLSATPERLFDKDGSEALNRAFGDRPIFDLPIDSKVRLSEKDHDEVPVLGHFLSQYYYDFETVSLSTEEQDEWFRLTGEIKKEIAKNPDQIRDRVGAVLGEKLKLLMIQRARIVKGAAGKPDIAARIVAARYPRSGRWIVYCEDETQMNSVAERIRGILPGTPVLTYYSRMNPTDRERTLTLFEDNPSIIVSIRCLDEGVDIPSANGAIILASSSNPREYVQRRGRLLRKAREKRAALIIDALVVPNPGSEDDVPFSIVRSELARAYIFAKNALNPEVIHRLWRVCQEYSVNLEVDSELGWQDEEWEE
jgi:superfamily II DNA or RNA helicase